MVNFDPDAAGANAAERSIQLLLDEGMHVRILELDGELDPDEYCKERGADAYRARMEAAKDYFTGWPTGARDKFDLRTAEGKMAWLQIHAAGHWKGCRTGSSGWRSPTMWPAISGSTRSRRWRSFAKR